MQMKRRVLLIIHDVFIHPFVGVVKALTPSTTSNWANWLHDWTVPPLSRDDHEYLEDHG